MLSPEALMKEMGELESRGVNVRERLKISEASPLILPYHVAMDQARESALGKNKIGTTGRGIGPAYEDKVARRGLRVSDLFNKELFAEKLKSILDYYNFQLVHYYKAEPVDFQKTLDDVFEIADVIKGMVADVTTMLHDARREGANILFEGAQGTMLDIDHGTYPFVTSSNTTAGGVATGSGFGPRHLDYVLGIIKAYCTRVGSSPFTTELFDEIGRGTATYDGMALAHAIIGYIHEHLTAKVLFSTHYHELTALSDTYEDLKNVHVGAIEKDGEVVFLHKIMEGPADKSYGIHVAKLAGLPSSLLSHAENILTILETNSQANVSLQEDAPVEKDEVEIVASSATVEVPRVESEQLDLFTSNLDQEVLEEIKSVRVMNLTPLQALQFIDQWQTRLKG